MRRQLASIIQAALVGAGLLASGGRTAASPVGTDDLRIATFGTSLTANGGWQAPLAAALEACLQRPVEVSNRGRAGAASDWGVEAVGDVAATRPDIVFIEFVANDSALNKLITPLASTANLRRIVEAFRDRDPDIVIYVMAMNPFSGRRSWMRPLRDRYEDAHRALAAELDIRYIDHRPAWAALPADEIHLAIADGLHPTPSVATAIIVPNIVDRLKSDGTIRCEAAPGSPR